MPDSASVIPGEPVENSREVLRRDEGLSIDAALRQIDTDDIWKEIEISGHAPTRTIRLSPRLAVILRSIAWPERRRVARSWFFGVAFIMWLSIPSDYLVVPHALPTIMLGHDLLITLALGAALLAWRRVEWVTWQGLATCLFVGTVVVAATMTALEAGASDFERFVFVAFFGMTTGISLIPLPMAWTTLAMLVLNVSFVAAQAINPSVTAGSSYLFTIYCCMISAALVFTRSQMNTRQTRALLFQLLEARSHRTMERMANTDALTGLRNRKSIMEAFEQTLATFRSSGTLSVAMIDSDDFKKFNDTLGHAAGDEALRSVASLFSQSTRSTHAMCGRIGGEEFLVIFPGATASAARTFIEKMMRVT